MFVSIKEDGSETYHNFVSPDISSPVNVGGGVRWNQTSANISTITLAINTVANNGFFDNLNYNDTVNSRGKIHIVYKN